LSMYLDESRIIDQYLVFPGDSIKMFIDLQKGQKVFAGPGYALFELQEQAEKLLARITREEGMKLHVRKGKNLFGSEERLGEFEKSQLDFGAKARLVPIDVPEMLKAWKETTTDPVYFRELGHLLSYYEGIIAPEILAYLKSELQSAFYIKQTGRLQTLLGYAKSEQERDLIRETFMKILPTYDVGLKTSGLLPPPEKQIALRYKILQLQAKLENQRIGELILNYPDGNFRDFILGKHISQMVKMGTESPEELEGLAAQVMNPSLKQQVQELVGAIQPESKITDFVFKDEDGKVYRLSDFEGKTLLVNTYFTGCSASSSYYKNVLSKIEQELKGRGDLVLISLSADREAGIWEKGNTSGLYNSSNWLRLNTGEAGYSHPFFRNYLISSAPRPILIGPDGRLISVTQLYTDPDHLRDLIVKSISQKPISHVQ
ncbi:TlpA family protein disulfide reductase, partial [Algoriphagus resistens]|uniref:TlpA family protein disulfide reductase n=1 Tax=Algoriphagus resistens TaxID=1750590 RepID=UPI000A7F5778